MHRCSAGDPPMSGGGMRVYPVWMRLQSGWEALELQAVQSISCVPMKNRARGTAPSSRFPPFVALYPWLLLLCTFHVLVREGPGLAARWWRPCHLYHGYLLAPGGSRGRGGTYFGLFEKWPQRTIRIPLRSHFIYIYSHPSIHPFMYSCMC